MIFCIFENLDYSKDKRCIVYLNESFVNFYTVKGQAIATFNMTRIPYVEKRYIINPNNMTFIKGFFSGYDYYNDDKTIPKW